MTVAIGPMNHCQTFTVISARVIQQNFDVRTEHAVFLCRLCVTEKMTAEMLLMNIQRKVASTKHVNQLSSGALMAYVYKRLGFVIVKTIVVTTQTKPTAPTTLVIPTSSLVAMATVFLGATCAMERTTVQTAQMKTLWHVVEHLHLLALGVLLVVVTGHVWL